MICTVTVWSLPAAPGYSGPPAVAELTTKFVAVPTVPDPTPLPVEVKYAAATPPTPRMTAPDSAMAAIRFLVLNKLLMLM